MMKSFAFCSLAGIAVVGLCNPLDPANDIILPSKYSSTPLQYAGGNSPYFPGRAPVIRDLLYLLTDNSGPNVNGIDNKAPGQCTVRQAAYVVRHGSRYVGCY
jgi:hypothetical protein